MSDQNWRPLNAEDDGCAVLITYRNEAGEEHVHVGRFLGRRSRQQHFPNTVLASVQWRLAWL